MIKYILVMCVLFTSSAYGIIPSGIKSDDARSANCENVINFLLTGNSILYADLLELERKTVTHSGEEHGVAYHYEFGVDVAALELTAYGHPPTMTERGATKWKEFVTKHTPLLLWIVESDESITYYRTVQKLKGSCILAEVSQVSQLFIETIHSE